MILPISIHLTTSILEITQGDVVAPITQRILNGTTNGQAHHVIFSLTTRPSAGTLMLDNHEVDEFKMADLGHVIYFMDDITHAYDHMRITMTYYDETMTYHPNITATVPIKINPLIDIDSFTINTHQRNVITTDVLDASQLADTTNSMPYYTIIGGPNMSDIIVERGDGMSTDPPLHTTQ
uniref:Cadherin domain-containing protein n=1 Tax=Ciona savignyi TaxID=51511 RepID=H2YIP5_CIOSA